MPEVKSLSISYNEAAGRIELVADIRSQNAVEYAGVSFGVCDGTTCTSKSGDEYGRLLLDEVTGAWKGYFLVSPELASSGRLQLLEITARDVLLQNTLYRNNDKLSLPLSDVLISGAINGRYIFSPGESSEVVESDRSAYDSVIRVSGQSGPLGTAGKDAFYFAEVGNGDSIVDFNASQGDVMALSKAGFNGIEKIRFKAAKSGKKAERLESKKTNIIYDQSKGLIYYNSNGKGDGLGKDGGVIAGLEKNAILSSGSFLISDESIFA
jgi:hypothetical protein